MQLVTLRPVRPLLDCSLAAVLLPTVVQTPDWAHVLPRGPWKQREVWQVVFATVTYLNAQGLGLQETLLRLSAFLKRETELCQL